MYKQPKSQKRKNQKRAKKKAQLNRFAKRLEKDLPKSEQWFRALYNPDKSDRFNLPFGKYIPDVINKHYKYVIEVDGSIHLTEEQKYKDHLKNKYYESKRYKVFRVVAYNQESYSKFYLDLQEFLSTF